MEGETLKIQIGDPEMDSGVSYTYETPPMPKKSQMLNYGLNIKDQKFKRTEIPDCFGDMDDMSNDQIIRDDDGNALLTPEQQGFVIQERDRIRSGCWYLIKGEPIFLTGDCYFYLNYWWIGAENEDGYPEFRYAICKYFYFCELVDKSPDVFGGLFVTGRRFGKALDLETDIPTPDGWKKMKDLAEGDCVFGSDGKPTVVTFVSEVMTDRKCYNVKLSDGTIIKADADHNWLINSKNDRIRGYKGRVMTTQQIVDSGVKSISPKGRKESKYSIVNCGKVEYEKKNLLIPPRILGLWLSDGSTHYTKFTNTDQQLIDEWIAYGKSVGLMMKKDDEITYMLTSGKNGGRHTQNHLLNCLRAYDLIKNKHIPQDYLESSIEDRFNLLTALFDGDGTVMMNGATYSFSTKYLHLAEQVRELAASLGYKVTICIDHNKQYNRDYYQANLCSYDEPPFKLQRQLDKINRIGNTVRTGGYRNNHRYIIDIEECDSVPVKCIQVDNENHTYLCTKNYVVTHNTEMELCRVYKKAITNQNKILALMSLTKDEAKENLFSKIVRSWDVMFEFFKPKHSGTTRPVESLTFARPPRSSKKQKEVQRQQIFLNTSIGVRATKVSALQGKKPFYTFVDEAATIDAMDMEKFWSTSKQALALGGGKKIVGKVMLPCTLEEMNPKGGERYYSLWQQSDVNKLTMNGRTSSGLIRYLKPYWEGLEGFIDEWGFDLKDEAIEFVENEYNSFVDSGKMDEAVRYRRQFPRNASDAFNIAYGNTLEEDVLNILKEVLIMSNSGAFKEQPCEIYEVNGEVKIKNVSPKPDALFILEEPHEGVEYVIGIDGTATDKESGGKATDERSEFAIVVTKKLEISGRSYCDVAYISKTPNRKEDMFRIARAYL